MKHYPFWLGKAKAGLGFLLFFWSAAEVFPQRVVSLAPGITEIVFALNKGNALVGVTKFCDYPAAAGRIKKIGGYLDVNTEALVALAPDIVIMYPEHETKMRFLKKRARLVKVRHNRFSDLLESILEIGRVLNSEEQARKLVLSIRNKMREISSQVKGKKRTTTILVAGRNADELKNMYIIGKKDFFNDLLEIAGGVNAYAGDVDYPNLSLESVIYINPDFIFEISAHHEGISTARILELWRPYPMISAVAKKQIRIIKDSFWLRPGPRVVSIAKELVEIFSGTGNVHE